MVYVANANECNSAYNQALMRNALFAAMTRSRAWVRVSGFGAGMQSLVDEFEKVKANGFTLKFKIPTVDELQQLRRIHRDLSPEEKRKRTRQKNQLEKIFSSMAEDGIKITDLDPALANQLRELLGDGEE